MSAPHLIVNKTYQIQSAAFSKELCRQYPYGSPFLVLELTKQDIIRQKKSRSPIYRLMSLVTEEHIVLTANELGTTFAINDSSKVDQLLRRIGCVKAG